jgi:hypothetical protein
MLNQKFRAFCQMRYLIVCMPNALRQEIAADRHTLLVEITGPHL